VRVRLTSANTSSEGRLEVNVDAMWAGVPSFILSNMNTTMRLWFVDSVCKGLGYLRGKLFIGNFYSTAAAAKWWTFASCSGTEASVADCSWSSPSTSYTDINIACTNSSAGVGVPSCCS